MVIHINKDSKSTYLDESISQIRLGFGWSGCNLDVKSVLACLTEKSKLLTNDWFIFNGGSNFISPGNIIQHNGYSLGCNNEVYDKSIDINLSQLPLQIIKIVVVVHVHGGNITLDKLEKLYLRIINKDTGEETHRLDIKQLPHKTCMVLVEINRNENGKWEIVPILFGIENLEILVTNIQII